MRYLGTLLLLSVLALAGACTPDSLENFEEGNNGANNGVNNGTNNNANNGTNNGGSTFTTEFVAVSGILATRCGQPACHGSAAANAFVLPTDTNATPAEMRTAIEGVTAASGQLLVNPGNPGTSDLWTRMQLPTSDPQYMPLGGTVLMDNEYSSIETWITNGAVYTQ